MSDFQLMFNGQVQEGVDPTDARARFAGLMRIKSPHRVEQFFSGGEFILRRALNRDKALRLYSQFRRKGLLVYLQQGGKSVKPEPENRPAPSPPPVASGATPASPRQETPAKTPPPGPPEAEEEVPDIPDPLGFYNTDRGAAQQGPNLFALQTSHPAVDQHETAARSRDQGFYALALCLLAGAAMVGLGIRQALPGGTGDAAGAMLPLLLPSLGLVALLSGAATFVCYIRWRVLSQQTAFLGHSADRSIPDDQSTKESDAAAGIVPVEQVEWLDDNAGHWRNPRVAIMLCVAAVLIWTLFITFNDAFTLQLWTPAVLLTAGLGGGVVFWQRSPREYIGTHANTTLAIVDHRRRYRTGRQTEIRYRDHFVVLDDVVVFLGGRTVPLFKPGPFYEKLGPIIEQGIRVDRKSILVSLLDSRHPALIGPLIALAGASAAALAAWLL